MLLKVYFLLIDVYGLVNIYLDVYGLVNIYYCIIGVENKSDD